jgi:hypothetical protein
MATFHLKTAAVLIAGIALTATSSFAQQGGRRNGGEGGRRQGVERAQPRSGGESGGRVESQGRAEPRGRVESQGRVEPRARVESQGRAEPRGRVEPYRGYDNRTYGNRLYDNRGFNNRSFSNRAYSYRPYGSYGYRSYGRSYVIPYGYRAYGSYGYRPGWSLNFYFGRPYSVYGYPAYGYPSTGYGYYAIDPGRAYAYGSVRIVDAPPDAQVFVDGYYAGVVDDYDGVFQHLNLEAGSHHIEIEEQGYPPIAFDVRVEPGQTITYRANR